jgi:hypothetical protein
LYLLYTLRIGLRSFLGHIEELLAKRYGTVDLGPMLQQLPSGYLIPDMRTLTRNEGITALEKAHPWASNIEAEIFLEGFDWGERYAHHNLDKLTNSDVTVT